MKRVVCILLGCLLAFAVFPRLSADADDDFLLCVVENSFVEDVSEDSRATYISGTIYVPYHALDSIYGIKAYYNERLQQLLVYTLDLRMTFDVANNQTYDSDGEIFQPVAVRHAGTIFIPIQFICDRFELYFSYTPAGRTLPAPIIRICAAQPNLPDAVLYARNTALTQTIYDNYQELISPSTPTNPVTPTKPVPLLTYLSFEGPLNEETGAILDTLEKRGYPAAFFLPAENPSAQPDLLRRIYASGYTVGLLLTEVPEDLVVLLTKANEQLCSVLHTKTRLVCVADGADTLTPAQRDAIVAAGFRLWDANIDPDPDTSSASALYTSCRRLLSKTTRVTVVRLCCNTAVMETLPKICAWLESNSYSVLTMNEWDTPINKASEIR